MFRDLLDEEGHILTHNFRPIQPLGDRIILFNIIDDDDNTLDNNNPESRPEDDVPSQVDEDEDVDNDLADVNNAKPNVLNDSPDNNLDEDEDKIDSTTNKAKLDSASTTHFVSLYLLSITILALIFCDRRTC